MFAKVNDTLEALIAPPGVSASTNKALAEVGLKAPTVVTRPFTVLVKLVSDVDRPNKVVLTVIRLFVNVVIDAVLDATVGLKPFTVVVKPLTVLVKPDTVEFVVFRLVVNVVMEVPLAATEVVNPFTLVVSPLTVVVKALSEVCIAVMVAVLPTLAICVFNVAMAALMLLRLELRLVTSLIVMGSVA